MKTIKDYATAHGCKYEQPAPDTIHITGVWPRHAEAITLVFQRTEGKWDVCVDRGELRAFAPGLRFREHDEKAVRAFLADPLVHFIKGAKTEQMWQRILVTEYMPHLLGRLAGAVAGAAGDYLNPDLDYDEVKQVFYFFFKPAFDLEFDRGRMAHRRDIDELAGVIEELSGVLGRIEAAYYDATVTATAITTATTPTRATGT